MISQHTHFEKGSWSYKSWKWNLTKACGKDVEKLESEINLMSELQPCETCEYEPSKKENLCEHIGNSYEPVSEEILFKCDFWNY